MKSLFPHSVADRLTKGQTGRQSKKQYTDKHTASHTQNTNLTGEIPI